MAQHRQWSANDFKPYKDVKALPEYIGKRLKSLNISKLFRFQWTVIKYLLSLDRSNFPGDVIVQAPTGTGKTLCYAISILTALKSRSSRPRLRGLVIVPTRELVNQLYSVFLALIGDDDLKVLGLSGDTSLSSERTKAIESIQLLEDECYSPVWKVDILISTPSRLVEHIHQRVGFEPTTIEFLVLDETDRLLSGQSLDWIETILRHISRSSDVTSSENRNLYLTGELGLRKPIRKLLFSATQTSSIAKLANLSLVNPTLFTYKQDDAVRSILLGNSSSEKRSKQKYWLPFALEEFVLLCKSPVEKLVSLVWYLKHLDSSLSEAGVIVFASSKISAHRLFRFLSLYFSAGYIESNTAIHIAELSSNLSNRQRRNVVRDFSLHKLQVVVSSDVATRGMDIENIGHVISFDVPVHVKTYLHRVGRTARAGHKGTGCTILMEHQAHHFRKLLRKIDRAVSKSKFIWKEMDNNNTEWSTIKESVMEIVTCMQCCIRAESRKLISIRKPLTGTLMNFLIELGRKYYRLSNGQSDEESNPKELMLDELQRFLGLHGNDF
ncbi:ATP-dependent RNA helicase dbp6 [Galdieria sulphuraria]|nr:ATP-dependent RNA helicase dbp6 [Galdieria sulphuraria]